MQIVNFGLTDSSCYYYYALLSICIVKSVNKSLISLRDTSLFCLELVQYLTIFHGGNFTR